MDGGALKAELASQRDVYKRPLRWLVPPEERQRKARLSYTGHLAEDARQLVLHYSYDGWVRPLHDLPLEQTDEGAWIGEIDTERHHVVDCVVREEDWSQCDNNDSADYRLWIGLDPVDAHTHVQDRGNGTLGLQSLRAALSSGGMTHALVSWRDNDFVAQVVAEDSSLTQLVWVSPAGPSLGYVRTRLAEGAAGLKLHPALDGFPANSRAIDPYIELAAEAQLPVTVHSGPDLADPNLIRQLAERFPTVPFVLYHTFLGFSEGRRRAARYARGLSTLYLETSWCSSGVVDHLIDEVGPNAVLFGSDAAIDGPTHFVRRPPNIRLIENYNQSLLRLTRRLPLATLRKLLEENARALFGLDREDYDTIKGQKHERNPERRS